MQVLAQPSRPWKPRPGYPVVERPSIATCLLDRHVAILSLGKLSLAVALPGEVGEP